jgi:hypothetical protein
MDFTALRREPPETLEEEIKAIYDGVHDFNIM